MAESIEHRGYTIALLQRAGGWRVYIRPPDAGMTHKELPPALTRDQAVAAAIQGPGIWSSAGWRAPARVPGRSPRQKHLTSITTSASRLRDAGYAKPTQIGGGVRPAEMEPRSRSVRQV